MSRISLVVGTRDEVGGVTIGAANVWERPGHEGLSVRLVLPDRDVIASVGTAFEVGGTAFRLAALDAHTPTGGHVLTIERVEAPPPAPDTRAAPVALPPGSGGRLAAACRRLTPEILACLDPAGVGVAVARWERSSTDRMDVEWTGARLGPSTTDRRTAVLDLPPGGAPRASATVTVDTIRWSPDDVAFVEVHATWQVASGRASCWARGVGLAPIQEAFVTGPPPVLARLRAALAERDDTR